MSPAALLAGLLALGSPAAAAPAAVAGDAVLHRFRGDVELRLEGRSDWVPAREDAPLQGGDEIRVGRKGFAEVFFEGGAMIHLRPESHLVIERHEAGETGLRLLFGTILNKLKGWKGRWSVRTPVAVAAVRGTEFGVHVTSGAAASATAGVFDEGEVLLTSLRKESAAATLTPGREAEVGRDGVTGRPRKLEALAPYRAQMRGLRKRLAALQRRYRSLPLERKRRLRELLGK